jgi:hypothetical protein
MRLLATSWLDASALWAKANALIRAAQPSAADFAVRIVDASMLEKAPAAAHALLPTHWDPREGRFVQALNFVRFLSQAGPLSLPSAVTLRAKTVLERDAKRRHDKVNSEVTKNE